MTEEEIRKAFESAYLLNRLAYAQRNGINLEVMKTAAKRSLLNKEHSPLLFDMFRAGIQAKEEANKLACNVWQTMSDEWRVCLADTYIDIMGESKYHATRADALAYAVAHGYRVVEE